LVNLAWLAKQIFCWCCVSLLLTVQKKIISYYTFIENNNVLDHKRNENVVASVGLFLQWLVG